MNNKKTKVIISSLIISLGLSGCSFNLVHDTEDKIIVRYDNEIEFESINSIDKLFDIKNEEEKELDYSYFIDNSDYTNATFAYVVGENTISSKSKKFDGKKDMTTKTFEESVIQPLELPISFFLFHMEGIADLVDGYGDCDINCKKLYTIDGDTLYYIDSTFTFNSFAEKYIGLSIKENDTMNAKILYRLEDDNSLTILYKDQTGIKEDCKNVIEKNFNNDKELVISIEKTVFNELTDKIIAEEYLLEALDEYRGTDNYYHESNEGLDFSEYKKIKY